MNIAVVKKISSKNLDIADTLVRECKIYFENNGYKLNYFNSKSDLDIRSNGETIENADLFQVEQPLMTDCVLVFYDLSTLKGKLPVHQHTININDGGVIFFYINEKADWNVLFEVFVHEQIHSLYIKINAKLPLAKRIVDTVHNFSGLKDVRPEATYSFLIKKLLPYLEYKLPTKEEFKIEIKKEIKEEFYTIDKIKHNKTKIKILELIPEMQPLAIRLILDVKKLYNEDIQIFSAYRSKKEQDQLFNKKITLLKGGESFHNYRRAFDWVFKEGFKVPYSRWERIGKLAEQIGMVSGIRFNDPCHFELSKGINIKDLKV